MPAEEHRLPSHGEIWIRNETFTMASTHKSSRNDTDSAAHAPRQKRRLKETD